MPVDISTGLSAANPAKPLASARWRIVGFILGIFFVLAIHVVGRAGSFCSPIRADSYVFAGFGYRIAQGEVLYLDVSDAKPPGIFLLNAMVYRLGAHGRAALIPVESLFLLLGYFAVYAVGRDLYGRGVGLVLAIAAALTVNFFLVADFGTEGFNLAESYMLPLVAAAVLFYRRARLQHRPGLLFLVGILLGLAFVLKQTVLPLAIAIGLHWTGRCCLTRRGARAWAPGVLALLSGICVALLPFVLLVLRQGTTANAWTALTTQAADRLTRATAWPGSWADVLPLWVPMAWAGIGLILWGRTRWSGRVADAAQRANRPNHLPTPADVSFLLIWLVLECVMLVYLPQRAFHYYVLSCLPLIFLSGLIWAVLRTDPYLVGSRFARLTLAAVAIWSIAFARPTVDTLVPTAISRYRSYDAATDRAYFDEALNWGHLDLG